jgi:hypothetical protein
MCCVPSGLDACPVPQRATESVRACVALERPFFPLGEGSACSVYHSLLQGHVGEAMAAKNCDIRGMLCRRDTFTAALGGQWSTVMPLVAAR